ncbi:MAG: glycogen synthase, partial [Actinobacteria bacterium]|nr:glycogen synthase [Actinomycetota bacterium]
YGFLFSGNFGLNEVAKNIKVEMNASSTEEFDLYQAENNGINYYFIKNQAFFARDNLYGTPAGDYDDNNIRFGFFSKAIFEALKQISFDADILHLHDYHFGLAALILKDVHKRNHAGNIFSKTRSVFTIHNIAYQGLYSSDTLEALGISYKHFNMDELEFYGKVNYMKAAIVYADKITTVSPSYSREILTPAFAWGLDGILKKRKSDLAGIINGIDYSIWNPGTDKNIAANYNSRNLSGKAVCKQYLIENMFLKNKGLAVSEDELNSESPEGLLNPDMLKVPLACMVSRLSEQKGIDLIIGAMDMLMQQDIYLIILGTGDEKYHNMLTELSKKYSEKFKLIVGYSDRMSRQLYSGSDIFLMPSNYEPCGLGQLISMKYGTIPVVRNTGGLADTVIDVKTQKDIINRGQGFKFDIYNPEEFFGAFKRALDFYKDPILWRHIILNAMAENFSWDYSALQYKKLYEELEI